MKRFFYLLLVLFVSVGTVVNAQQEASTVTEWNGKNKSIAMRLDSLITLSYKATDQGMLYIYADNQSMYDNVPVSIWGGLYADGAYNPDFPLEDAGAYGNGLGVYGKIRVLANDEVRFTLSTPAEAGGVLTRFTLKSLFFKEGFGGDTWENPIELTQDTKVTVPVYKNYDVDYLGEFSNATFCRFTPPTDGVASILTEDYLIYYIKEELYGSEAMKAVPQDVATNDHEFVVEKGKPYIILIPNSRPTGITFKMNSDRVGGNCKDPIKLTSFPATIDLMKGENFYHIDLTGIGDKYIMEMATEAGWKGAITYLNNCNYESVELLPADIDGIAKTFIHNLEPLFMGNELIINIDVTDVDRADKAVTFTLREPQEGECFDKATPIQAGENSFSGSARDYWMVYTASQDVEVSLSTTGTLKHMLYSRGGGDIINEYNVYRLYEGQSIYICISTAAEGTNTVTLTEKAIEAGDYCDMPIFFELGNDIVIKDRGDNVSNFRQFTASKSGFAILETSSKNVIENHWSIYFRNDCDGKTLSYVCKETTDAAGNVTARAYKVPIMEGNSYLVEVMSFANNGDDVIFTTRFEEAREGEICATAIELTQLGGTITIDNTPESSVWYKYVADRSGFYTTHAKIGRGSNLRVKVGDCDAEETNASDDNRYSNAYMAGYKVCKVYVEEGQTLYIGVTINADPGDEDGTNYYIIPTFAEARPGERFVDAITVLPGTEYTLTTGHDGYDTWYVYTLPTGEETSITISSTVKNYSSLIFYTDEKTSLSAYKGDFTQTTLTNEEDVIIGKNYLFAAPDTPYTLYVKAPIATVSEPVKWKVDVNVKDDDNNDDNNDDNDDDDNNDDENKDDNNGIETMTVSARKGVYDLFGRRLNSSSEMLSGRIYIIDGHKVVAK